MPKIDTTVGHLVDMITRGELRLPELQRRYVWPSTRVRDLLDSLYRGYPSGTILVWEAGQDVPIRDLAVSQEESPFGSKLLLDGQQRLTSLSAIIRAEPVNVRNRTRPIEVAFNLNHPEAPFEVIEVEGDEPDEADEGLEDTAEEAEEPGALSLHERLKNRTFVVASNAVVADANWVKVSDIFTKSDWQILKPIGVTPDDQKYELYSSRLQRVRAIKNYPYVMEVLGRDLPYEEVAEIFVRVNSLGMKLRGSDLALAQITARWRNSLVLFEKFAEDCEKVWFTFDLGILVRALVVFATKQSRFRTVATIPLELMKESWEEAKEGLRFAVNFLRSNAGIEDESLLSSPFLVIPIAVFAVTRHEQMTQTEERNLLHWLFVANARGHYSGSSETMLDADLNILFRGGDAADLLDVLKQKFGRLTFDAGDFTGKGWRNPLFPITYLALREAGAKDWWSGLGLSLTHQEKNHYIENHHIFPKSQLATAGYEASEINEMANLAFISGKKNRALGTKVPTSYFPDIISARGPEALQSQKIPLDEELWRIENYRNFLEWRRAELADAVNEFLGAVSTRDRRTLDVSLLIEEGESELVEFKSSARFNSHTQAADTELEATIAKTVAGFMNARGGTLVIGVNDSGIPIGLEQDLKTLKRPDFDGYQQFLLRLLDSALGKDVLSGVFISFPSVDGVEVCAVEVAACPRPTYVKGGTDSRFYVRIGNTTRPFSTREAVNYVGEHWSATS